MNKKDYTNWLSESENYLKREWLNTFTHNELAEQLYSWDGNLSDFWDCDSYMSWCEEQYQIHLLLLGEKND